jgi:DNA invertase Pin-like site-specific DNA recombinase
MRFLTMANGKFISYLRVSTTRQGFSGLGIEAQRQSITSYLNGGAWELVKEFVEVESGKRTDRFELNSALNHCKLTGATLVISRLDRLARNAHFLLGLQNAGVKFVAVDMPDANEMTVGIMAVIAQGEAKAISNRTKLALEAARQRGTQLGNPANLDLAAAQKGRVLGVVAIKEKAAAFAADTLPIIRNYVEQGMSLNQIAKVLNNDGILSARGKSGAWTPTAVRNVLMR